MTSSETATSSTVRAMTPSAGNPPPSAPKSGPIDTRPRLGLSPTTPQHAAGMRMEPPRSLASASATIPPATAAALPPDDPPAVSSGCSGLRVIPKRAFSVTGRRPSSGVFVLPTMIAPASRSRRTWAESWSAIQSPKASLPSLVGIPSVAESRSFTPIGTPQSGRGSPGRTLSAASSACSANTATNAFTVGFCRSISSSDASTSSRAGTSPARTRAAWSTAERPSNSSVAGPLFTGRSLRRRVGSRRPPRPHSFS